MNTHVRTYLIERARKMFDEIVSYQQLSDDCKLGMNMHENPSDRKLIGKILDEISSYEYANGRPLLSALVKRFDDNREGNGFYKLYARLKGQGKSWQTKKNDLRYETEEIQVCINCWSNKENYLEFK